MTNIQKKELKSFLKKSYISIFTFIFALQLFFPLVSKAVIPTCSGNIAVCPGGFSPVCSNGRIGFAQCRIISGINTPGCVTSKPFAAFFPGEATCVPSSTSSSSSGGSSSSSSSSSSGNFTCTGNVLTCTMGTFPVCTSNHIGAAECRIIGTVNTPGCVTIQPIQGFFPSDVICVSSSSSSSSSGGSSSSSSGGVNTPSCSGGVVTCSPSGAPTCPTGYIPVCGSVLGLRGSFAGPGCYSRLRQYFYIGQVTCVPPSRVVSPVSSFNKEIKCNEKNLCRVNNKRTEPCRDDLSLCKCACAFTVRYQKQTPRCSKNDLPECLNGSTPRCRKTTNVPQCYDSKLVCQDLDVGQIDLSDLVYCKK